MPLRLTAAQNPLYLHRHVQVEEKPKSKGPCPKCGKPMYPWRPPRSLGHALLLPMDLEYREAVYRCVNSHKYSEKDYPAAAAKRAELDAKLAQQGREWQEQQARKLSGEAVTAAEHDAENAPEEEVDD